MKIETAINWSFMVFIWVATILFIIMALDVLGVF